MEDASALDIIASLRIVSQRRLRAGKILWQLADLNPSFFGKTDCLCSTLTFELRTIFELNNDAVVPVVDVGGWSLALQAP